MITIIPIPQLRRLQDISQAGDFHTAILFTPDGLLESPTTAMDHIREDDPLVVAIALLAARNDHLEQELLHRGCDDVMTAPICAETLAERLLLRIRQRGWSVGTTETVHLYETSVDFGQLRVYRNGTTRPISRGLADLLQFFLANANQVVSRVQITETLWADHVIDPQGKNLDMHVAKLRRLIEPAPRGRPRLIQTVRGIGYRFVMPDHRERKTGSVQTDPQSVEAFYNATAVRQPAKSSRWDTSSCEN